MILYHLMTRGKKNRKKGLSIVFDKYYPVFLWLILYLYAAVQYKFGIPNYLEFGDQMYYWLGDLFAEGIWNPAYVATQTVGFRGWMCNLFPSISQHAGNLLRIDPVFIYLIFTSGAICWLCSYVMPKIYELLTNHKAGLLQKNAFILVYLFFWNGTLTAVLTDMFGAVAFLSGTMYALRFFFGKRQVTSAIGAGLFWAISCNFRTAYQYGIVVMIIAAIIVTGAKYIKRRKARREEEGNAVCYPKKGKKAVAGILCAIGMFVLTSFPQYAINVERGFSSFLPYDYAGAVGTLMVYADGRQATLLESSANQSLQYGYSGYPYVVSDDQMLSLKTQLYNSSDILSLSQILSVYSNNPLETLIYLVKKLLVAFDPKTNVTYPLYSLWRETPGLLFSFLNYFVIGSALYILVVGKRINIREKAVCAMFFIGLVLPQMFVHVEWRYFLSTYMLLYMLFTYHFVGAILTDPDEVVTLKKSNYLQYITVFILLAFTLSLTIFA